MGKVFPQAGRPSLLLIVGLGLLAGCGEADTPDDATKAIRPPEIVRIETAQAVLDGAHIRTLDPGTMNDAEIGKAIGAGPRCEFRYTSSGRPVLAVGMAPDNSAQRGVLKLNGSLVVLEPASPELASADPASAGGGVGRVEGLALVAKPIRTTVSPAPEEKTEIRVGMQRREANMIFEVGQDLKVGYRGYLECVPEPPQH
ncbi:hypothetical protein FBY14_102344 [Azospirillum brasilense]|nr:hypothetical protein FBY14_102344 [Azospirillum brasilense]